MITIGELMAELSCYSEHHIVGIYTEYGLVPVEKVTFDEGEDGFTKPHFVIWEDNYSGLDGEWLKDSDSI